VKEDGVRALWRSYPTTLTMNIPYAAVVVAANESFKKVWIPITPQNPKTPVNNVENLNNRLTISLIVLLFCDFLGVRG